LNRLAEPENFTNLTSPW